ncbi:MAG: GIY-YIG nuclease family protein [bacterium]
MYKVYVLKSEIAKKSYVGMTRDLEKRILEHNSGKSEFTSHFMPWKIIHVEEYSSEAEAVAREKYLKSASGRRKVMKKLFANLAD